MAQNHSITFGLLAALGTGACANPRSSAERPPGGDGSECYACHGAPENENAAPPPWASRPEAAPDPHQAHLQAALWHGPVACETCHVVPAQTFDPGHIDSDLPAEVAFGGLAAGGGVTPRYSAVELRCGNTYCHGATLSAGTLTSPTWEAGEGQAACGTCHGLPPAGGHPQSSDCHTCHGAVIAPDGTFADAAKHVNGQVELGGAAGCDSCHGAAGIAAPPRDLAGNTDTSELGVGAHRAHLAQTDWHGPVPCGECHVVPATLAAPGHLNTPLPAEVIFGPRATAEGTKARWDRGAATCSVRCHGVNLGAEDGTAIRPVWTRVDGSQSACGACHALPPSDNHPARDDCATCHGAVIGAGGTFTDPDRHVDGKVDVRAFDCNDCHGEVDGAADEPRTWAPPNDLVGNTDPTLRSVGAHQAHLALADWHRPVVCADCHVVPGLTGAPGHLGPTPAEVVFGAVARSQGAAPEYNLSPGEPATCSNVYCHGSRLTAGADVAPEWTQVGLGGCGTSCHGWPPDDAEHGGRTDCQSCHGSVMSSPTVFRAPALHINGRTDR